MASPGPASANVARLEHEFLDRFGVYQRLVYQDRSYSNEEELRYAGALAAVLRERGVAPGDRVLLMLPNIPEMTASLQAVWTAGAVAVPAMPQWGGLEAGRVLRDSGAAVVATVPELTPRLLEAARDAGAVAQLLVFGESDGGENLLPLLRDCPPAATPAGRSPDDLALLLYTSGTTGPPKGAMLRHGNIRSALDAAMLRNSGMTRGAFLQAFPFSHSFGMLMLKMANASGFTSVLMPQVDPVRAFEAIERHQIRYMAAAPAVLVHLLHHPGRRRFNLSSLRRVISGGAALAENTRAVCEREWNCRVEQGYGLSETFSVAAMYDEHTPCRPGSSGPPVPGVQVRIVDDRDETLPPGALGEVWLSSGHIASGYWNDGHGAGQARTGEWFRTGDVGYLDEDGFLYITDRRKDLIVKAGESISPREIEELLCAHPAVADAAVTGMPDLVYGEDVCAWVQLKPGSRVTGPEIQAYLGGLVSRFKVPARVVFHPALPRNAIGKVSKRELRNVTSNRAASRA